MPDFNQRQLLLMRIRDELCKGNSAELARRIKKDPTYVNRLFYPIGKKGGKGIVLEIMSACAAEFGDIDKHAANVECLGPEAAAAIELERKRNRPVITNCSSYRVTDSIRNTDCLSR